MKKRDLVFLFLLLILLSPITFAQDPGDVSEALGNEFNIPPENIPTSAEDIQKIKDDYLKKEWGKIIEKNKFLGPIHKFFIDIKIVFKILFNHDYEISLTLFLIIVLWVGVVFIIAKGIQSVGLAKSWKAVLMGVAGASVLAWARFNALIVGFVIKSIYSQGTWWMRLIVEIIIIGAIVVAFILFKKVNKSIKEKNKKNVEKKSEERLEVITEFTEGMEKGRKQAKK